MKPICQLGPAPESVALQQCVEGVSARSQRLEIIGQLACGVAHDFNNFLGVILASASLLLEDLPEGDPLRMVVAEQLQAADRCAGLTRHLLAFGRVPPSAKSGGVNLSEALQSLLVLLQHTLGRKVRLSYDVASDLYLVDVDPMQVERVLMNLVRNACDAMPDGGALVVETANIDVDAALASNHPSACVGPHAMLSVTDTGSGMSENILRRIFEPFYTTKVAGHGTGLGLATCHDIVRQCGGFIAVESQPGTGTTFKVFLPRAAG